MPGLDNECVRVIDAYWESDRLRLWAIDSDLPASTPSRKRVRPHPYALGPEGLAEALGLPGPGSAEPDQEVLNLPGVPRHPVPPPYFPAMADAPRYSTDQVTVRPWLVPTLDLAGPDALALLRRARHSQATAGPAVMFAWASLLDEHPLLLFAWLGRTEEEALDALDATVPSGPAGELAVEVTPLSESTADFWTGGHLTPLARPRPFDPLSHWEGATPAVASGLAPMYERLRRGPGGTEHT